MPCGTVPCPEGSSHPCQPEQHRAEAEDWREPQDFGSSGLSDTPPPAPAVLWAGMWLRAPCTPGWDIPEVSWAVARTWAASRLPRPALAPASPVLQSPLSLQWSSAEPLCPRARAAHPEWHKNIQSGTSRGPRGDCPWLELTAGRSGCWGGLPIQSSRQGWSKAKPASGASNRAAGEEQTHGLFLRERKK